MQTTHGDIHFKTRAATRTSDVDEADVESEPDRDEAGTDIYSGMDSEYDDW